MTCAPRGARLQRWRAQVALLHPATHSTVQLSPRIAPLCGRASLGVLTLVAALGCGSSGDQSTDPGDSGIRVLAGAGAKDTVFAHLAQSLTVQVRPNGRPVAGLVVRFQGIPSQNPSRQNDPTVLMASLTSNQFSSFAVRETDANGKASVLVQLGAVAGTVGIEVACPELGLVDTVHYTVTAGASARFTFSPRDTLVVAGGTFSIDAKTTDRYGNPRQDAVTFASPSVKATVSSSGTVTAGQTVGRVVVTVRAGTTTDSLGFTIVPDATIASLWVNSQGVGSITRSRLDGSNLVSLVSAKSPAFPWLSPRGDRIVYQQLDDGQGPVSYVIEADGERRRLLDANVMQHSANPTFSADGQLVYFSGRTTESSAAAIWRVRLDGTGLQKLSTSTLSYFEGSHPAPSPDGSRVAYADESGLVLLTIPTGVLTVLSGYDASSAVFSQDGERLAYREYNTIVVRRFDGSPPISIENSLIQPNSALTWLPGGEWLLGRAYSGPFIANSTTGEILQLPSLANFYQMSAIATPR
jgi:hypothetical protein